MRKADWKQLTNAASWKKYFNMHFVIELQIVRRFWIYVYKNQLWPLFCTYHYIFDKICAPTWFEHRLTVMLDVKLDRRCRIARRHELWTKQDYRQIFVCPPESIKSFPVRSHRARITHRIHGSPMTQFIVTSCIIKSCGLCHFLGISQCRCVYFHFNWPVSFVFFCKWIKCLSKNWIDVDRKKIRCLDPYIIINSLYSWTMKSFRFVNQRNSICLLATGFFVPHINYVSRSFGNNQDSYVFVHEKRQREEQERIT